MTVILRVYVVLSMGLLALAVCLQPAAASTSCDQARSQMRKLQAVRDAAEPTGWCFVRGKDASKPAILLFHGIHQGEWSWTKPSSHDQYIYDYKQHPKVRHETKESPGVGIFKIGKSEKLKDVDTLNWVDFLVNQGYTVATWTQDGLHLEPAYQSAKKAYAKFLQETAGQKSSAPPPVALIAHSRGGLVIRKLLKDPETDVRRVRWVITIHSPHQGSEMARAPSQLFAEITDLLGPVPLPKKFKDELHALAVETARPLTKFVTEHREGVGDESRELTPGGPFFRNLEGGEKALPGVKYYTFGGTNSRYYRLYTWMFTPGSATPQFRGVDKYFKWEIKPVEIEPFSPMFDKLRDFVHEIKPGYGDGLVTAERARLPTKIFPNAIHEVTKLNHAEVLWDQELQRKAVSILSRP
jgi:hypothetical protein